jgi:hypothetical protein
MKKENVSTSEIEEYKALKRNISWTPEDMLNASATRGRIRTAAKLILALF